MVRAPFYDENGVKKGAWSADEDEKLKAYIQKHGHGNWRELPRSAGLLRCGKSCRLRWINYLRPDVKRGNYSEEEKELILQMHKQHGNKWSMIASKLSGRTDNEIKNYWHTHLKKFKASKVTKKQQNEAISKQKSIQKRESETKANSTVNEIPSHQIFESCPVSPLSSEISTVCSNQESTEDQDSPPSALFKLQEASDNNNGDFWADPFLAISNPEEAESTETSLMNFDVIGGFIPPYDLEFDEDYLLYQVMKELPENYQLYP